LFVLATGDELAGGLQRFAKSEGIAAASFKAVGALSSVRLGRYSWPKKTYEPSVVLDERLELLSRSAAVAHAPTRALRLRSAGGQGEGPSRRQRVGS
jgi:predicted DNA-binding protein with PD1-like motif